MGVLFTKPQRNIRSAAGLTLSQEAYCAGRASGMTVKEAIAASGSEFSEPTARRWEGPKGSLAIQNRITELRRKAAENSVVRTGLTRSWVIEKFMEVATKCTTPELWNPNGANAALRSLGDVLGMFKQDADRDETQQLSDADLTRVVAELARQTGFVAGTQGLEEASGPRQARLLQAVSEAD